MPPRMSFSKTTEQYRARTKDVTRRDGWLNLKPGDVFTGIEKGMGLKKGEKQVVLHDATVVSVRRERLGDITVEDVTREGFPGESVEFFIAKYGKPADHMVTRIEFRHHSEGCDDAMKKTIRIDIFEFVIDGDCVAIFNLQHREDGDPLKGYLGDVEIDVLSRFVKEAT